jgi:hypothetical protein
MSNIQQGYGHSDLCAEPFDFYVPLTGFSITMQTAKLVLNPAGTLATGAVTLPLNPPDGCIAEISSTQIVTALTVAANTGDLIVSGVLAAVTGLTPVASAAAGSASATIKYRYTLFGSIPQNTVTGVGSNPRTWVRVQ